MYEKERKKMSTETMNKANTKTEVQDGRKEKINARTIAQIGMLGAVALVLMLFEIPLPLHRVFTKLILVKFRY